MAYQNLGSMFRVVSQRFSERNAYMFKSGGSYQSKKFSEARTIVEQLAAGLRQLGAGKEDKILLLSENRMEWALSDYAILSLGSVTVPIYPTLLPSHIEFIINNSEGKILLVSGEHQLQKVREIKNKIPMIKHIILMDGTGGKDILTWNELLKKGQEYLQKNPDFMEQSLNKIDREQLASIIYTSGTTGVPKGVMLTHGNFLSNVEAALEAIQVTEEDVFLSFLPLSHIFERMAGHFLATHTGASIAYAENIETVGQNLQEVHPTVMTSVPRFFEKIYARLLDALEEGPSTKKKIFLWAIEVGKKANLYKQKGLPLQGTLKMKHKVADKLVYSKLRERMGGRARLFVSGGAPLSKDIAEFFNAAGLLLLEGYGLTETSPVITVSRVTNFKFGSPGLPVANVEVVIAEDGEILTRGPHVMKGYYKNPEETKEAIDREGWLHTGDIGYIDKDGFIFITDRKKNIIVTSGGKNVAPQPIENLLVTSKYIEQSVVLGDKRKYCSAFIVPNLDKLKAYAEKNNISYTNEDDLLKNSAINQLMRQEIDAVSGELASYETVKKFRLLKSPFTIESGELTPSLKVKRNVVEQRYKILIDEMYQEDENSV